MERLRTTDGATNVYQWVDMKKYIVMDIVTGELARFGYYMNSIGNIGDALDFVSKRPGWEQRLFIVELTGIAAYLIKDKA